ncbi:hypothetical protein VTO42DRAFT_3444 [Malbranchea cinnamomea]
MLEVSRNSAYSKVNLSKVIKPGRRTRSKVKRTNRGQTIQVPIRNRQEIRPEKDKVEFAASIGKTQTGAGFTIMREWRKSSKSCRRDVDWSLAGVVAERSSVRLNFRTSG